MATSPLIIFYVACGSWHSCRTLEASKRPVNYKEQGHPTSKLAKTPLRDISRLLVMLKDCLKICFDQLEKFDLFRIS